MVDSLFEEFSKCSASTSVSARYLSALLSVYGITQPRTTTFNENLETAYHISPSRMINALGYPRTANIPTLHK